MTRRIGIDVGGTNTEALLLDDTRVVSTVEVPTTADVSADARPAAPATDDALAGSRR